MFKLDNSEDGSMLANPEGAMLQVHRNLDARKDRRFLRAHFEPERSQMTRTASAYDLDDLLCVKVPLGCYCLFAKRLVCSQH